MDKLIITAAPLGNVVTKELNENAPVTAEELIRDIKDCVSLGASVIHLHVRDEDGMPTCRRDVYEKTVEMIRLENIQCILQLSTGVRGGENTVESRGQMLDVKGVQMASLSVGSSNFANSINANSPQLIKGLAEKMYENSLTPELECFDVSMIENGLWMRDRGILKDPLYFNMVMNVPGSIRGTSENLRFMVSKLPEGTPWNLSVIGKAHFDLVKEGMAMGGNIRTGIEDVLYMPDGSKASNVELVRFVRDTALKMRREIATCAEAASILKINM